MSEVQETQNRKNATPAVAQLFCPACRTLGMIEWAERPRTAKPREMRALSAGFLAVYAGASDDPRILCARCRTAASQQ